MNDDEMTRTQMLEIESKYMMLTNELVGNNVNPFAVAAVMTKLAMMIYKTSLSASAYDEMIDSISERRNIVKPFNEISPKTLN